MSYLTTCFLFIALLIPISTMADHASADFETGTAGTVMATPGSTMPKGKFVAGINIQTIGFDEIPDERLADLGAAEEDVHSTADLIKLSFNFAYSPADDLTIGISLPYIERHDIRAAEHHSGLGEVEAAGDTKGVGDVSFFFKYRLFHIMDTDAALLAGIKTPTGSTSETEIEGALFEPEHQPGSGSWDPFLGLSFSHSWGATGLSANILYTVVTEGAQDTILGDIFNYNIALSRRLFTPPEHHDHHTHGHNDSAVDYFDLIFELNGDLREKTSTGGRKDKNEGGHVLYLSPGMKMGIGHRWTLFTSIGIPIINSLNGEQSDPNYRILSGLSFTF